jgi:hypothetical protein
VIAKITQFSNMLRFAHRPRHDRYVRTDRAFLFWTTPQGPHADWTSSARGAQSIVRDHRCPNYRARAKVVVGREPWSVAPSPPRALFFVRWDELPLNSEYHLVMLLRFMIPITPCAPERMWTCRTSTVCRIWSAFDRDVGWLDPVQNLIDQLRNIHTVRPRGL